VLSLPRTAREFDRLRKIRNGINYYGDNVTIETAKKALKDVPEMIEHIKKAL